MKKFSSKRKKKKKSVTGRCKAAEGLLALSRPEDIVDTSAPEYFPSIVCKYKEIAIQTDIAECAKTSPKMDSVSSQTDNNKSMQLKKSVGIQTYNCNHLMKAKTLKTGRNRRLRPQYGLYS